MKVKIDYAIKVPMHIPNMTKNYFMLLHELLVKNSVGKMG